MNQHLRETLNDYSSWINKQNSDNKKLFDEMFYFEKNFLKLIIIEHKSLWAILAEYFFYEMKKIKMDEFNKVRIRFFSFLLTNQINDLLAILKLLESGLALQSNNIFRNYMEISEKALAIISNREFYENYKTETYSDEDDKEVYKKTKPFKTFECVKDALSKLPLTELYDEFIAVRKRIYGSTSKSVHGNMNSVIFGAFSVQDDKMFYNIGGKVTSHIKSNIECYIIYSKIMMQATLVTFILEFKIHFQEFSEEGKFHTYIQEVNNKLLKKYGTIKQFN